MSLRSSTSGRQATEIHTAGEVEQAIGALDPRAIERLHTAASDSMRRYGLDSLTHDHEDLLSEAFTRLLSGIRRWRRGIGFEYQVARVMDSIASNWRRHDTATPEVREVELMPPDGGEDAVSPLLKLPSNELGIEERMIAAAKVREITELFADDPAALLVLDCLGQELSRREMRERTRMSEKQLAATIRRIRRRAKRLRPGLS